MKKLITLLLLTIGLVSFGQTTANPDIVCVNATGEQYFVTTRLHQLTSGLSLEVVEFYKQGKGQIQSR